MHLGEMMFSFFKKNYHEPVKQQIAEVQQQPIGPLAIAGEDCDELQNAQGPFGHSFNNPIPVNGLLGAYKYLGKLLSPKGNIVYFHRIGSLDSDVAKNLIDAYEVVDMAGGYWDLVFIDMYHPRRSNKAPEGYKLKEYNASYGDLPLAYGVDIFCPNFPFDLADAIQSRNNLEVFARKVRERLSAGGQYNRPESQAMKLAGIKGKIVSMRT